MALAAGLSLLLTLGAAQAGAPPPPLKFGLSSALLPKGFALRHEWAAYLSDKLQQPVQVDLRGRSGETLELLKQRRLELAWLSDYPYVLARPQVRLLAVPVYRGKPSYQAYLLVPATDSTTTALSQLRGMVFAYAGPLSHTGHLLPRYELHRLGEQPSGFFRLSFFSWSPRNSIQAVAKGVADGAYVDSYAWDAMNAQFPDLLRLTRIAARSDAFAFPPIVVRRDVDVRLARRVQKVLLEMSADAQGRALLGRLGLDGFVAGEDAWYEPVAHMVRAVAD